MADCITPIVDILTRSWDCSAKRIAFVRELEDNLIALRNASNQLKSVYLDVKTKVEIAEEEPQLKLLNEVTDWLGKVEALQNEVEVILQEGDQETQRKCLGGHCPKNCRASYKLSKKVTKKFGEVREFISKGHFNVVAQNSTRTPFDEMPLIEPVILESSFDELCACFENDKMGIIGLYGMGGVGKTTLLKKFNNEFLLTRTHDVVIWVVVSNEVDLGRAQEVIRNKLHVQDGVWSNKTLDERAIVLYRILKKKRFVLLLDDVWRRIDLVKLGVPPPNNYGSKIIFTTRSEEVCSHMEAHRCIRVKCLAPEKAFELFKVKVGESTLDSHPNIPHLAKIVADECQGLPLALCTVGRSMTNKVSPNEWERAIEILKSYPSRFSGMVDYVYHLLEFSYDSLSISTHKCCFLYCSLFPEDYSIRYDELISLWIGEGFLADFDDDIYEARIQGEDIISSLKHVCLLENGDDEYYDSVKMHDVIRDMALWLACDHGTKTKFLVKHGVGNGVVEVHNQKKWQDVERLSLRGSSIEKFSRKPHFPKLLTILIRDTNIVSFPIEICLLKNIVRVLDLSGNRYLKYLPAAIGIFVNLEYMNLSATCITKFPKELMNLKKLRFLLLDRMWRVEFPRDFISSLVSLQAFSMLYGVFRADDEDDLLDELEGLEHLQELSIELTSPSSVQKLLMSPKLQGCINRLRLHFNLNTNSLRMSCLLLRRMEHLKTLSFSGFKLFNMEKETLQDTNAENIPRISNQMQEYVIKLRDLHIYQCEMFDLNWLQHAPSLEFLTLQCCESLKEVISEDFGVAETAIVKRNLFSCLTVLRLLDLPNLRSICRLALQFSCLKEIEAINCPNLIKLPFDSQSAVKNLKHIKGDQQWWSQIQWEDEVTKDLLLPKFQSHLQSV